MSYSQADFRNNKISSFARLKFNGIRTNYAKLNLSYRVKKYLFILTGLIRRAKKSESESIRK
jgi:hypothetical protein